MEPINYLSFARPRKPDIVIGLIFVTVILSLFAYTFPDELDIVHYYQRAELEVRSNLTLWDVIKYNFESRKDFIYFAVLHLFQMYNIPLNIATACFMTTYYYCMYYIISKGFGEKSCKSFIFLYALMSAPFVWVQCISRNLAGIAFLYIAIISILRGNRKYAIIFAASAILTHFSIILYVLVICASYFLKHLKISRTYILILLGAIMFAAYSTPGYLIDLLFNRSELADSHFSVYAESEAGVAFMNQSIGYGDKFPMIIVYLYSVYLLLFKKEYGFMYWCQFLFTLMLSFFMLSSLMMTNRVIMLLPIFLTWNAIEYSKESADSYKRIRIISMVALLSVLAHFWAYREFWTFL